MAIVVVATDSRTTISRSIRSIVGVVFDSDSKRTSELGGMRESASGSTRDGGQLFIRCHAIGICAEFPGTSIARNFLAGLLVGDSCERSGAFLRSRIVNAFGGQRSRVARFVSEREMANGESWWRANSRSSS